MKNTIIVNLFAGPGAGKSTGASYIYSRLKMLGIDAEYASEYAKDKVWEMNKEIFNCQFYIVGSQAYRIFRLFGKVDVIVTDSPVLVGLPYSQPYLHEAIIGEFNRFKENNLNYYLTRKKAFSPNGRRQSEEESKELDAKIKKLLTETQTPFTVIDSDEEGYQQVIADVVNLVKNPRPQSQAV